MDRNGTLEMKAPQQGVHYHCHLTGNGTKRYEWVSKETGTTKQWEGALWEWRILWGDDVTVLPTDYANTTA
jgi:translation initiation factor IF-1